MGALTTPPQSMNDRNLYNLSHLIHTSHQIGRIQTLKVVPVEAGASIEMDLQGWARLATTRKEIVSDCQLDICAFFVPHRLVYGQQFIDFINEGVDSTQVFNGLSVAPDYRYADYLTRGHFSNSTHINRALVNGYNRIFYNYFAVPSLPSNADNTLLNDQFDWFPTNEPNAQRVRQFGRLAARLPHILNGANSTDEAANTGWEAQDLTPQDSEVPIDTVNGVFTLQDLAQIQARYKSESQAAWFAHFYQDIMKEKFGTHVSEDADPRNLRPKYLGRHKIWMSGYDIDGSDDATFGTFQGKTIQQVHFGMPRHFFAEHGFLWVMGLFRFPFVHTDEINPLLKQTTWSYKELAGDPEIIANEAPIPWNPDNWLANQTGFAPTASVQEPYGQHYRYEPNRVHDAFKIIPGYPFSQASMGYITSAYYHQNDEYRKTFQTQQIGQAQMQLRNTMRKYSPVPGIASSIFAGT